MRALTIVPLLVLLLSTAAAAQGVDPGRVSVGGAAGLADPLHGDFTFKAAAWDADVRVNIARFLAASVFLEGWRHTEEDVRTNVVTPGGRIDRIISERTDETRVLGGSLLARSNGRVAVNGGGGISYMLYSRESSTSLEGCTPASPCGGFTSEFDNSALAAHVQGGLEVRVLRRLAVTGNVRFVVPVEDPGGGHLTYLAGARVLF